MQNQISKKGKKPDSIDFECSFCRKSWTAPSSKFKMEEQKGSLHSWARFYMNCPKCKREVSVIIKIK